MKNNLLVVHGGGPTAVMNTSLAGVLAEARQSAGVDRIFGARFGMGGLLREDFLDLTNGSEQELEALRNTPGSAIGTSRDPLQEEDYYRAGACLRKHGIRFVLLNGGNGTMDTCGRLHHVLKESGIQVVGIPKTMDNDLSGIDHSPGYLSAARYLMGSVREVVMDVRSLPIHVVIIEALGRNAGWLTAAPVLLQREQLAPDLILLPEIPFDSARFLIRIQELHRRKGGIVVLVSEGIKCVDGNPVTPPIFTTGRATYFGDVSSFLAQLVVKELGMKARSEKPGLFTRASLRWRSRRDQEEAEQCGRLAVHAALNGQGGQMISIQRDSENPSVSLYGSVPIEAAILKEKTIPLDWIDAEQYTLKSPFFQYLSPLLPEQEAAPCLYFDKCCSEHILPAERAD